ncbi:MAG: fructosamine kinase family protein [Alphaproteobacteria bacterium]|nr:fructosamine kinase family protein [Alphaproteobacteria bacterium]MBF0250190.1 fructosamine kinase family protein [Alphaproteobacteria bacterium]
MPSALEQHIHEITGQWPNRVTPLSGGCVGDVFRAEMPSGPDLVAKVGDHGSGLAVEGRMLLYLAEHSELPVPEVLHADDGLLLQTLLPSGGGLGATVQRHAAEVVAALHSISSDKGFGFDYDTVIGGVPQPNPWHGSWLEFFAEQRLMHMGREAERVGRLPTRLMARLERFAGLLDTWLDEPRQSSLIHGDMWSGNVLSANGRITGFVDPAIYYADPEIELAFTTLFGTFGDEFFHYYTRLRPIEPGFFEDRRAIYNLYPLLVHVRLFGGSYVGSVERTLDRFVM